MTNASADRVDAFLADLDASIAAPPFLGVDGDAFLRRAEACLSAIGPFEWRAVGSCAVGTSVQGYSDVDMLAVFADPVRHAVGGDSGLNPDEVVERLLALDPSAGPPLGRDAGRAFDRLVGCLSNCASLHRDPGVQDFPAVRFDAVRPGVAVELVPGAESDWLWDNRVDVPTSALAFLVFPGSRQRWFGTHPELHSAVLDFSIGGVDYPVRRLIRLLKLLKYRSDLPLRSYFVELFALRWIEGSHDLTASTVCAIVDQMQDRKPYAHTGPLARDLAEVLDALLVAVRASIASSSPLQTVDLSTPETVGQTSAFAEEGDAVRTADALRDLVAAAREARVLEQSGDVGGAIAGWARLFKMSVP